jgi:drug/metabolite transporter (DMT)-like permease
MSRRATLLFAVMCILWGIPYLLIKVAVRDFDPATLVFMRTAIGSVVLVPVAIARKELKAVLPYWRPLLAYTVAELAIPWILLSTAEERLPSSLSGLLVASVPLVGAVLALGLGQRSILTGRRVTGLVIGFGGVAVLSGFDVARSDIGSAAMIGAVAVGYATGPVILARKLDAAPAMGVVAASLLVCAIGYAPWGLTHLPSGQLAATVWMSVIALGLVCTALAFVVFFALIRQIGPLRATVITYVNPAVAVVLGVSFLHESFGLATAAGFILTITGCLLATGRSRRATPAEPTVAPATGA